MAISNGKDSYRIVCGIQVSKTMKLRIRKTVPLFDPIHLETTPRKDGLRHRGIIENEAR